MPPEADGTRRDPAGGESVRNINSPLGQRAAATTYDPEKRTVELVVATDALVKMPGWELGLREDCYYEVLDCSPAAVDLSQVQADNCPLLDSHKRYSIDQELGRCRTARFETNKVIIGAVLGQSEGAKTLEANIAADTAPKVSAGYRREQVMFERFEGEIPVYRVTKWTLREASFVPIAADPNAGVRTAEQTIFPCTINEGARAMPPEANGAAGAAPTTTTTASTTAAAPAATVQPGATDGARGAEQPAAAGAGNPSAQSRFTGAAALAFVDQARAFGDTVVTRAGELVAQNERGEISVEAANAALLTASAEAQRAAAGGIGAGGRAIEITADERAKFLQGAANSIIMRAGLAEMHRAAAKARGEEIDLDPGEFRGVMNADLARMCLERSGARITSYDRHVIVGEALTHRASNTTSDFAVLLENVMHKTLQAAYGIAPDTWRRFCGIGSVSDFRAHPRYLRGTFGVLDDRNEDGQFKNKSIPDGAKESITAKVKGNIIALTRDAIVNDDLGAFNFLAVELARAAKLSIEVDVYALLALNANLGPAMNDTKTLFHADHVNIASALAPSVAAFDAIRVLMAQQKDLSGNEYLDIRPHIWLGPIGLGGNARVINGAEYDPDTANKLQKPNMVKGLFNDVVDTPRLSGTRWYAFADPSVAPAIEVVFLNGNQEPFLEQREGWRTDGTEWKVRHDYGVGAVNWRCAATNAGA